MTQKTRVVARATYIGQRINLKQFQQDQYLALSPLVIQYGAAGKAVIYRYGVIVSFSLDTLEQTRLLEEIAHYVESPYDKMMQDSIEIETGHAQNGIHQTVIQVGELSITVIQTIADILAKTVILEYYERSIATAFDQIEPLSQNLKLRGRGRRERQGIVGSDW